MGAITATPMLGPVLEGMRVPASYIARLDGDHVDDAVVLRTPAAHTFENLEPGTYRVAYIALDAAGAEITRAEAEAVVPEPIPDPTPLPERPPTRAEMELAILSAVRARDAVIIEALTAALQRKTLNARQLATELKTRMGG